MTDPIRKLAERIVDKMLDDIRDHELVSEGECACMWESSVDEIITALTRILREELEGGAAESSGVAADTEVPAPDQPHESYDWSPHAFVDFFGTDTDCRHVVRRGFEYITYCGKDRSDPIHQTNEVSDEPQVTNYDAEAEARAHEGVWVGPGDEVENRVGVKCRVIGPVLRKATSTLPEIWVEYVDAGGALYANCGITEGYTRGGQPVLGFRERHEYEYGRRIADLERELADAHEAHDETLAIHQKREEYIDDLERELRAARGDALHNEDMRHKAERERDEARAERDELLHAMPKSVMRRIKAQGWVRLDDATIERVVDRADTLWDMSDDSDFTIDDSYREALRNLRDGKLKEGE